MGLTWQNLLLDLLCKPESNTTEEKLTGLTFLPPAWAGLLAP